MSAAMAAYVVETISDRVAVMYFGSVVELASASDLFGAPRHPYTRLLLDSAPVPGRRHIAGEDKPVELPNPFAPLPGCAFAPRCPRVHDDCRIAPPPLAANTPEDGRGHAAACFHPLGRESDGGDRAR